MKISSAKRVLYFKVKHLKEQEDLHARLEKLKRKSIQKVLVDLHEELARKARIAEKKREMAEASGD